MHRKTIRRRRAVLALLVLLSLLLLSASLGASSPGGPLNAIQVGFLDIFTPVQRGVSIVLTPVRDVVNAVGDVVHAVGERNEYRAENRRLVAENAQLEYDRRQYLQLRGMFTLDQHLGLASFDQVTAQVSGESPSVWYSHVTIDAGSSSGIRTGDVVVDGDGLVGRVTALADDAAVVTLLTDPSSAVAARDARSGAWGIAEPAPGSTSELLLAFPSSLDVAPGDLVVTAGTTAQGRSLFPANIPIGRVATVKRASQTITLEPQANVRQLEDVQVLTARKPAARAASGGRG